MIINKWFYKKGTKSKYFATHSEFTESGVEIIKAYYWNGIESRLSNTPYNFFRDECDWLV